MTTYPITTDVGEITITLPVALLAKGEEHVPTQQRSAFIQKAIEELLAVEEQTQALAETAGIWASEAYADLDSMEAVESWISELRSSWHIESVMVNEPTTA